MPRILLPILATVAAVALPASADAAVLPDITGDTLTVTGDDAPDLIILRPGRADTLLVNGISFDRGAFTSISIRSGGGDDTVRIEDAINQPTTIETGAGADVVTGGPGAEIISGGDDGDLVRTGGGDDLALLGAGNDTAIQGPGDGSDSLEGQTGIDTVRVLGTSESEEFTLQALGSRARITRDVAPATADMAGIETAEVSAAGGSDLVDLGDLEPTDLAKVVADAGLGDGAADAVAAQGRDTADAIGANVSGEDVAVSGLPGIALRIENATTTDRLTIFGRDGNDALSGSAGARIGLMLDGGAGTDSTTVSTTSADERIDVFAAGGRTRITTPQAGSTDLASLEQVRVRPQAGEDDVVVQDLAGTGTQRVDVDVMLNDSRVDTMTVVGTPAADSLRFAAAGANMTSLTGLGAEVRLVHPSFPAEKVVIEGREGDDTIDASGAVKDTTQPFIEGGPGKDVLVGSPGQDVINGGRDNDVALMVGGLDTFNWLPGDGNDVVEGGLGTDFLNVSGSGANEKFDVSPVGGRVRFTRDVGNVNLDLGDVERIDAMPAGGADTVHVADVSGTDLGVVTWELAPFRGTTASDGALDRVTVDGTNGNDAISVGAASQQVRVTGLSATVEVNRPDLSDELTIDSRLGNDLIGVLPAARNLMTIATL